VESERVRDHYAIVDREELVELGTVDGRVLLAIVAPAREVGAHERFGIRYPLPGQDAERAGRQAAGDDLAVGMSDAELVPRLHRGQHLGGSRQRGGERAVPGGRTRPDNESA
jgi:hypothetical protein